MQAGQLLTVPSQSWIAVPRRAGPRAYSDPPAPSPALDGNRPSTEELATSRDPASDFYQITVEVQVAIYNSVLLAWKEKVGQAAVCKSTSTSLHALERKSAARSPQYEMMLTNERTSRLLYHVQHVSCCLNCTCGRINGVV